MNLGKLRKATELMREALEELDLSTESQGASGGCGANDLVRTMRDVGGVPSESLELAYRPPEETIESPDKASQTEATTPLASMEGVSWCAESDAWNCKYCRKAAECEERRSANRELWSAHRDFHTTHREPWPSAKAEINPAQVDHARIEVARLKHMAALDRAHDLQWAGSLGPVSFVGYPFTLEQAPITLDHVAVVDKPPEDPEVKLLNDLLRDHKGDTHDWLSQRVYVTGAYARDPRTVCSGSEDNYTQTKLGFLNQMRVARGAAKLVAHFDGGVLVKFSEVQDG